MSTSNPQFDLIDSKLDVSNGEVLTPAIPKGSKKNECNGQALSGRFTERQNAAEESGAYECTKHLPLPMANPLSEGTHEYCSSENFKALS